MKNPNVYNSPLINTNIKLQENNFTSALNQN